MIPHTVLQDALKRATAHCRSGTAHSNLASALSVSWARLHALLAAETVGELSARVERAAARYLTPSTFKPPRRNPYTRGDVGEQGCRWKKQPGELRHGDRRRYGWHKDDGAKRSR
jgi:hypothetical protein